MNPCEIEWSSLRDSPVPFIFQLPATSGRIPGVIDEASRRIDRTAGVRSDASLVSKTGDKAIDSSGREGYCRAFDGKR